MDKKIIIFYFFSIVLLTNGAFVTAQTSGTPLIIWRQLIWMVGMLVVFRYFNRLNISTNKSLNRDYRKIVTFHRNMAFIVVVLALFTIVTYNFNLTRLAFAFWTYFSGLPFVILPFLITNTRCLSPKSFFAVFFWLGIFLTAGLIADYYTNGFFTNRYLPSLECLITNKRYCFLSEAPTTFGVYYCFCAMSGVMYMYYTSKVIPKALISIGVLSFIIGAWFTGSRQIVAVLAFSIISSYIYYTYKEGNTKWHLLIPLILLLFIGGGIKSNLTAEDSYRQRFSSENIEEDTRSNAWEAGIEKVILTNPSILLFGEGVAYSQGQKALPNEIVGSHYENTFLARISEIGIIGALLLVYPIIWMITKWRKQTLFTFCIMLVCLSYLFISYVSPNGSHQTTQMTIFLSLGLLLNRHYFDLESPRKIQCI